MILILVMGGLYFGVFTPSEAGAIGAFGAFLVAVVRGRLTGPTLFAATKDSLRTSCFILTITIGAMIFSSFLAISGFTRTFAEWVVALNLPRYGILIFVLLLYVPLGMLDTLAMLLLTVPVVFPIISSLGFDPIWFGILVTIMTEMALITPPIGMNAFIVQGVTRVPLQDVFRGILPFFVVLIVCIAALVYFPQISLFLPGLMK